jgi:enterochelin esterase-like enzyme
MTACNPIFRSRLSGYGAAALLLAAAFLSSLTRTLAPGHAALARQARLREVVLRSSSLPESLSAWVCLPRGYGNARNARRRYPVVYLLHGSPGAPRDWFDQGQIAEIEDDLVATKQSGPMILVAADGRGPEGDSQCTGWLDASDGRLPMERVFTREFIPEIDRRFRTVAARWGRALLGVSAGGYAAFNLGLRHPGVFGVIAAHSGYFIAQDDDEVVQPMLGTSPSLIRANSPFDLIAANARDWSGRLYIDCGADDDLVSESVKLHRRLVHEGIAHRYAVVAGDHSWNTWHERLPFSLKFISQALRRPRG